MCSPSDGPLCWGLSVESTVKQLVTTEKINICSKAMEFLKYRFCSLYYLHLNVNVKSMTLNLLGRVTRTNLNFFCSNFDEHLGFIIIEQFLNIRVSADCSGEM
jgi:hypothetical protein